MKHLLLFLLLSFLSFQAIAQSKYSNEFLTLGVGARAHGMGGAVCASVADAAASYWNPAGLTNITSPAQFHGMHAEWFAGIAKYDQLSFGKKLNEQHQSYGAISIIRMGIDNIPNTLRLIDQDGNINYDRITTFSAADYAGFVSYGRQLGASGHWFAGGSIKIIHRTIGAFGKAWGFGADIGLQYRKNNFSLAFMGRDLTTTFNSWNFSLTEEEKEVFRETGNDIPVSTLDQTLPSFITAAAYKIHLGTKNSILAEMDLDITTDGQRNTLISSDPVSINPHIGLEGNLSNTIFIRAGISNMQKVKDIVDPAKTTWTIQPNVGIGIVIKSIALDYAFTNIGDATGTKLYSHIFSLILNFDNHPDQEK